MLKGKSRQESHIGSRAHLEMHLDTGMIDSTILCVRQADHQHSSNKRP